MDTRTDDDIFAERNAAAVAARRAHADLDAEAERLRALIAESAVALEAVEAARATTDVRDGVAVTVVEREGDQDGRTLFDTAVWTGLDTRRGISFREDHPDHPDSPWAARLHHVRHYVDRGRRQQGVFRFASEAEARACAMDWVASARTP